MKWFKRRDRSTEVLEAITKENEKRLQMQSEWRKQPTYLETDEVTSWKRKYKATMYKLLAAQDTFIPGFLTQDALRMLSQLSELLFPGARMLEIGSYCGQSTRWILLGCILRDAHLYCIDPFDAKFDGEPALSDTGSWEQREQCMKDTGCYLFEGNVKPVFNVNMEHAFRGLPENLTVIRGLSQEVVSQWSYGDLDIIFIDGDHSRCRQDVELWLPHLRPHGMLILDDVLLSAGSSKYGVDCPNNTYMTLLQQGWKEFTHDGLTRAVTRDPDWWAVRYEAVFGEGPGRTGDPDLLRRAGDVSTVGSTQRDAEPGTDTDCTGSCNKVSGVEPVSSNGASSTTEDQDGG